MSKLQKTDVVRTSTEFLLKMQCEVFLSLHVTYAGFWLRKHTWDKVNRRWLRVCVILFTAFFATHNLCSVIHRNRVKPKYISNHFFLLCLSLSPFYVLRWLLLPGSTPALSLCTSNKLVIIVFKNLHFLNQVCYNWNLNQQCFRFFHSSSSESNES